MNTKKTILISPLEWGLGHAGRIVPLAERLSGMGHRVIIASGKEHKYFFARELPAVEFIELPGFRIRYSGFIPQYIIIFLNIPRFIYHIFRDKKRLGAIIEAKKVDIVISDSRPGLRNKSVKSAFITHMVRIPLPGWTGFPGRFQWLTTGFLAGKFDYLFVPDNFSENNISGRLSHGIKLPLNARFTGILSRFSDTDDRQYSPGIFCTVILSGPEPQRSILREKLIPLLKLTGKKCVILEGNKAEETAETNDGNITSVFNISRDEMRTLILSSEFIISRPGYTTLMELVSLGRSAIVIPTPGQTEQEYLARYLSEKGWFTTVSQTRVDGTIFNTLGIVPGRENIQKESEMLLSSVLSELLEDDHKQTLDQQAGRKS